MRIVKDYPPNQLIPAQLECFNYILKHFKKHHGICNGREFYYWNKGWVMYPLEHIKEDVMDLLGNRYRKTALTFVVDQLTHKLTKTSSIPDHHIPFLEGYYDIRKEKFIRSKNYVRDHGVIDYVPVKYDRKATCSHWIKALSEYFKNDRFGNLKILALQQFMAYCLTTYNFNIALCLLGDGGNGKSTVGDVLRCFFIRHSEVELQDFNDQNAILPLQNSRFNVSNEVDNSREISWQKFKTYVEGRSTIGWIKHQDKFQFQPKCKFLLCTNEPLRFKDRDYAIMRRLNVIEFKNNFRDKEDRDLLKKLKTELPGILNWMLEELNGFIEDNGRLAHNELFKTAKEEQYYLLISVLDSLEWKQERSFKDVYEIYVNKCISLAEIPIARNSLGPILKDFRAPYQIRKGTGNYAMMYKICTQSISTM